MSGIATIEALLDDILEEHRSEERSPFELHPELAPHFEDSTRDRARFVVVPAIPKPDVQVPGLEEFMAMDVHGITYKSTYFLLPSARDDVSVHFHELVHVVQWAALGPARFIERYIGEIRRFGYADAPLERMAYGLQERFRRGAVPGKLEQWIRDELARAY